MKCAFYEKEITLPLGCDLSGYFNVRNGSDIKDRLYAKAIVVSDGSERVAIVCADACGLAFNVRENIAARVERFTDIKADNIIEMLKK